MIIVKDWKMEIDGKTYSCSPPCSMYSVLIENNVIQNPYYGLNEDAAKEYSEKDCTFFAKFDVAENMLNRKFLRLKFNGLDTLCDVYVNGKWFLSAKNFHRFYDLDAAGVIKKGKNTIEIRFHSPTRFIREAQEKYYLWDCGCEDGKHGSLYGIGHIRKPNYSFGWDWGICLPDMGIWKSVELNAFDDEIRDFYVRQVHLGNKVVLKIFAETASGKDATVTLVSPEGKTLAETVTQNGRAEIEIINPELWWPNGYGAQPLYTVTAEIEGNKDSRAAKSLKIGLRTLTFSQQPDKWGREFCAVVNGVKIFAMGANIIPTRTILPHRTKEHLTELIKMCAEDNFNMLRVWGGGLYGSDEFYDLCDRLGILVWQDFMFACTQVSFSEEFRENCRDEFIQNVVRLRSHASLALFSGNNEMEPWVYDHAERDLYPGAKLRRQEYLQLYERYIPAIVEKYAPDVFYWPSSPSSGGGFFRSEDENYGDSHYWDTWQNGGPFENYRNHYFRFLSEFGFQALPPLKTVLQFADEKDLNPSSAVMDSHQRNPGGTKKLLGYLTDKFPLPSDFGNYVYATQIIQANAIKYGVEHFRANRGRCMGTLFWQVNDCWPVISWSSVDWENNKKALQYYAKRFFAPAIVMVEEKGFVADVYVTSERTEDFDAVVKVSVKGNDNSTVFGKDYPVNVKALSAQKIDSLDLSDVLKGFKEKRYLSVQLCENGKPLSETFCIFTSPKAFKFLKPDISVKVSGKGDLRTLTVSSNVFTPYVMLDTLSDLKFGDNFVDLTGKPKTITVGNCKNMSDEKLISLITVRSVYDLTEVKQAVKLR